ncbi:MAG TPA: sigma-70 family RNA polymerase sigma factor [Chthoniobacteraceae bacterium]|nr:sigma-70 family RNA polymerase sigma factor [Chthoniobacteraceae bacterium]
MARPPAPGDQSFVTPGQSDREKIFTEWLQDYGGIPVKVAHSFAANSEDQHDLRQQMYLQIWRSAASFSARAKASTWIYRVCLNTAMTWRRSEKRRRLFFASINPDDLWPNESDAANDPRLETLYFAIRQLRPADRALILLYLEERSYREIAEITGLTETNTGVRLQRVKLELAQRLDRKPSHD